MTDAENRARGMGLLISKVTPKSPPATPPAPAMAAAGNRYYASKDVNAKAAASKLVSDLSPRGIAPL